MSPVPPATCVGTYVGTCVDTYVVCEKGAWNRVEKCELTVCKHLT